MKGFNHAGKAWRMRVPLGGQSWRERADCRMHADLPWTEDTAPTTGTAALMAEICASCPVWRECATHVLSAPAKNQGGFWAGVWIPWMMTFERDDDRILLVQRARATLRNRLAVSKPLTDDEQL